MRSKFYEDKRKEELFGKWLDAHFYANCPIANVVKIERKNNVEDQKRGIDVAVQTSDGVLFIDEKATLHYINKNIPTFAFELLNRTSGAKGWLFNHSYATTHYLLAWPSAADPDNIQTAEDYTGADVMLLKREDLINLLAQKGLTEAVLVQKVEEYRPQVTRETFKFTLVPGVNLFFTEWLAEKPVNIVISKSLLDSVAEYHERI